MTTDTNEVSDTPRTDAYYAGKGCKCAAHNWSECGCDVDWTDPRIYELEAELAELWARFDKQMQAEAEVESLKDLLNRALNEIEKFPFHNPRLTAFTAHRLAEKYREKMTNKSTKPVESQEDDK